MWTVLYILDPSIDEIKNFKDLEVVSLLNYHRMQISLLLSRDRFIMYNYQVRANCNPTQCIKYFLNVGHENDRSFATISLADHWQVFMKSLRQPENPFCYLPYLPVMIYLQNLSMGKTRAELVSSLEFIAKQAHYQGVFHCVPAA